MAAAQWDRTRVVGWNANYQTLIERGFNMQTQTELERDRLIEQKIQNLRELDPGMSFPLDTACDGILHRDEILLPA